MPQGKFANTVVVLLLLLAPLVGERLDKRSGAPVGSELTGDFRECPRARCYADFQGEGRMAFADIVSLGEGAIPSPNMAVLVLQNGEELLWQPFYHDAAAPPPRLALRTEGGRARLLVYDGMTGLSRAVFAVNPSFGRDRLSLVPPSREDLRVFDLMAVYDTEMLTGRDGRDNRRRALGSDFGVLKLGLYYLTLCVIAAVALYRKSVRMSPPLRLNSSGGNP